jgi:hypothetical protein
MLQKVRDLLPWSRRRGIRSPAPSALRPLVIVRRVTNGLRWSAKVYADLCSIVTTGRLSASEPTLCFDGSAAPSLAHLGSFGASDRSRPLSYCKQNVLADKLSAAHLAHAGGDGTRDRHVCELERTHRITLKRPRQCRAKRPAALRTRRSRAMPQWWHRRRRRYRRAPGHMLSRAALGSGSALRSRVLVARA